MNGRPDAFPPPKQMNSRLDQGHSLNQLLLFPWQGNTCLHYAVCHSNWPVVQVLLDQCPTLDVNRFNRGGYTPLMLAAVVQDRPTKKADLAVLEQLVSRAEVNLPSANPQKQNALLLASMHGFSGLVELILRNLKSLKVVNERDAEGSTALMGAVEHNHVEVVKLLLDHPNIDLNCKDNDGVMAIDIAMNASSNEIASLIYAHEKNQFKLNNVILQRIKEEEDTPANADPPLKKEKRAPKEKRSGHKKGNRAGGK
ncbi:KN motif and ankyrin repeat domain [Cichlidogyrus casuarinus]|uniref:KN motif and ankyrin repeat domain n=1 Tax=Cichlidogyrus casuarinus TaxID=1844966 RepID=A0ABD2QB50_9PLAT